MDRYMLVIYSYNNTLNVLNSRVSNKLAMLNIRIRTTKKKIARSAASGGVENYMFILSVETPKRVIKSLNI